MKDAKHAMPNTPGWAGVSVPPVGAGESKLWRMVRRGHSFPHPREPVSIRAQHDSARAFMILLSPVAAGGALAALLAVPNATHRDVTV